MEVRRPQATTVGLQEGPVGPLPGGPLANEAEAQVAGDCGPVQERRVLEPEGRTSSLARGDLQPAVELWSIPARIEGQDLSPAVAIKAVVIMRSSPSLPRRPRAASDSLPSNVLAYSCKEP